MKEISQPQETSTSPSREDFTSSFDENEVDSQVPGSSTSEKVSEQIDENQLEIDEKFQNLPKYEAALRTSKSRYDKLYQTHQNTLKELNDNSKIVDFLVELEEDDTILEAYLRERKPELIQKREFSTVIKEKLNEEFPEFVDSKPSRNDADDDPGGRAWLYFKRLDELYSDLKGKGSNTQTIKEIRAERKRLEAERGAELQKQLNDVQNKMNWNEEMLKRFVEWSNKASILELAKMYKLGLNTLRIDSVSNVPGQEPQKKTLRQQFIESL